MAKKDKKEESTGTAGTGVAWSHPLASETEDGARIVYVAVPNEDTIKMTEKYQEARLEREPRINALTTVIGLRQFSGGSDIAIILADAKKVEEFILSGAVPAKEEGPAGTEADA